MQHALINVVRILPPHHQCSGIHTELEEAAQYHSVIYSFYHADPVDCLFRRVYHSNMW